MSRRRRGAISVFASVATIAALVTVGSPPAVAVPTLNGSVSWNDIHQTIDGFGASGAFGMAGVLQGYPTTKRTAVLDALFSPTTGAGLSIVRNLVPIIEPTEGTWTWTGDADQTWLMNQAKTYGVSRFESTVWSPPAWMKTNNDVNNGGHVLASKYPQYAEYLSQYVLNYQSRFGLTITDISPANEPDAATSYPSAEWTGAELQDFIKNHLTPNLASHGVTAKVVMPEKSHWSEDLALAALNDAGAVGGVSTVAGHGYFGTQDPAPFATARAKGKSVWQTEVSDFSPNDASITDGLRWAKLMNRYLTTAEVNAWSYWWLVNSGTDDEGLVQLFTSFPLTKNYTLNKRLYTMGNYSRFVRPGWVRLGSTFDFSPEVLLSAFKDPATGKVAIVAVNNTTSAQPISVRMNGFSAASMTPSVTSSSQNLAATTAVNTSGGTLSATLAASSVTTFTATAAATSPFDVTVGDLVQSAGQTLSTNVVVKNLAATSQSGTVTLTGPAGFTFTPSSINVSSLAAGASSTTPVNVAVTAGTAQCDCLMTATAVATGALNGTYVKTGVDHLMGTAYGFAPNSAVERFWMADAGETQLNGAVPGGNARFADAASRFVYRLQIPSDVTSGTITVDIGNQFLVESSADGVTYTTRLTEPNHVTDLSNRAVRSMDLNTLRGAGRVVYLRVGDSQPADGWGAWVAKTTLNLVR